MDYNFTAQDFADWLSKNRAHFRRDGYNSLEVSDLAEMAGFTKEIITAGLSHFEDAMAGSNFERRADFQIKLEVNALERSSGKTNLQEQWMALYMKTQFDRDFENV